MKKLVLILLFSSLSSLNAMTRFTARNDTDQEITIVSEKTEATVQAHEEEELYLPCESEITVKDSNDVSREIKVGRHTKLLLAKGSEASGIFLVSQHVTRPLIISKGGINGNLLIRAVARYDAAVAPMPGNDPSDYQEISYPKEKTDPIITNLAANITTLEIQRAIPEESYPVGTPIDRIKLKPNDQVNPYRVTLENDTDGLIIHMRTGLSVEQLKLSEKKRWQPGHPSNRDGDDE